MNVTIVTATRSEARAAQRAMPDARVVEVGMGLDRYSGESFDTAIVCGVGGGLRTNVGTGTVVVASEIAWPGGIVVPVDPELRDALADGARRLGLEPIVAPILTSPTLVTGAERVQWAQRGYAAVDMESGGINASRLAAVRVILDTPNRELSPAWRNPANAVMQPRLWNELLWLARHTPRCARIAAAVVGAGLAG